MNKQTAITIILIALVVISSLGWCSSERDKTTLSKHLSEATDKFTRDSLKNGQEIITQRQSLADERNTKSYLENENRELAAKIKKVQAVISTTAEVVIKEKIVAYHDTVYLYASDSSLCIPVGTLASKNTEWYNLSATIDTFGLSEVNIGTHFTSTTVLGTPKQPFIKSIFKPEPPSVIQTFDNPHVTVTATNNRVVDNTKKPKRLLWLISGLAAGFVGGFLAH